MNTLRIQTEIPLPASVELALDTLENNGHEAWIVGGCVRDAILKRPTHDYDIATSAGWQQAEEALTAQGFSVYRSGIKHGTITALRDELSIEITTYRHDADYSDGRHPDTVQFVSTIEEDLARRDFTMNALAYHPQRGILDYAHGYEDIEARVIRTVGNAEERFSEDGLRILRGLRFASELGFSIEAQTLQAMHACKMMLLKVSAERTSSELDQLLLGPYVQQALITSIGILGAIMPEIVACEGFDQHTPYHIYDVWEHITHVVENVAPLRLTRWAAFLHDIGKPGAFFMEGDRGHFYGHAKLSVVLARSIFTRLKFSPQFSERVLLLIALHDHQIDPTPQGVKRALRKMNGDPELFQALLSLKRADCLGQSNLSKKRLEICDKLESLFAEILEQDQAFSLKQLAINGNDIMALGVPRGPRVGELLNDALTAVIEDQIGNNRAELIAFVKQSL